MHTSASAGRFAHERLAPADDLAEQIAHFWWVSWDLRGEPPFVTETLPHPTVHLVFEGRRAELTGVPSGAFRRQLAGLGRVFGIKFRPATFHAWLGAPLSTITDQVLPLRGLLGPQAATLARQLAAVTTAAQARPLAEAMLRQRQPPLDGWSAEIRDLVERMERDASITRAETAAKVVGVRLRTLQRWFSRLVGVSPKWVIQRYRLHEAAAQLTGASPPRLAELAAALGYADQAHFTRDFKAVVGVPPSAYLAGGERGGAGEAGRG